MTESRLTPLQRRVLSLLARAESGWTLGGGGALAVAHTRHRSTRDLDLFWYQRDALGDLARRIMDHLREADLPSSVLQSGSRFTRLRVSDGDETTVVDLIAEPSAPLNEPVRAEIAGVMVRIFTAHELLVEKLCALLERSELRDLVDVRALVESGADLTNALRDAPRKDGGFSPLLLSWALRELDVVRLASAIRMEPETAEELANYRDALVDTLLRLSDPRT